MPNSRSPGDPPPASKSEQERRRNQPLRELLDELVVLVRTVSRNGQNMSSEDLEYAQERLQWLADEIWQSATQGAERPPGA